MSTKSDSRRFSIAFDERQSPTKRSSGPEMRLAAAVGLFAANTARDYMSTLRSGDLVSNFTKYAIPGCAIHGRIRQPPVQPTDKRFA